MAAALCAAVLLLLCSAALTAGCVSAGAVRSVQDWNAWSDLQQNFSHQVDSTLVTMDGHERDLNTAITGGNPDMESLRRDFAADKENLDGWIPSLMALDAAATRFYANTSVLNGTAYGAGQDINANINVYLLNMNAARGELTTYCRNLDSYLAEGDPDYADDSLRVAAEDAKERALLYRQQADEALAALDADAARLERAQGVI